MAIEVKGLADTLRQAKDMVRQASDEASKMAVSAERLKGTVLQVIKTRKELDNAQAELEAALGLMTNGGPPLTDGEGVGGDTSTGTSEEETTPTTADIEAALKAAANQVRQDNVV